MFPSARTSTIIYTVPNLSLHPFPPLALSLSLPPSLTPSVLRHAVCLMTSDPTAHGVVIKRHVFKMSGRAPASSAFPGTSRSRQVYIKKDYNIQSDDLSDLVSVDEFKKRCAELCGEVLLDHVTASDDHVINDVAIAEACKSVNYHFTLWCNFCFFIPDTKCSTATLLVRAPDDNFIN